MFLEFKRTVPVKYVLKCNLFLCWQSCFSAAITPVGCSVIINYYWCSVMNNCSYHYPCWKSYVDKWHFFSGRKISSIYLKYKYFVTPLLINLMHPWRKVFFLIISFICFNIYNNKSSKLECIRMIYERSCDTSHYYSKCWPIVYDSDLHTVTTLIT